MNVPWYTCVPHPDPPSHLPLHPISQGHPSAPAPRILYPASNPDWQFISYMIVYMFQCHSAKSSHPLPLTLPTSSGGRWEGWSLCKYRTPARVTRKPTSGPQETRRVHASAQIGLRHLSLLLRIISTVLRHWSPLCSLPLKSLLPVLQRQILAR